jgi:DNA modification methylase
MNCWNIKENKLTYHGENLLKFLNLTLKDLKKMSKNDLENYLNSLSTSKIIDEQSGELTSGYMDSTRHKRTKTQGKYKSDIAFGTFNNPETVSDTYGDSGGASRINHIIKYEEDEMDLLMYEPKVCTEERNIGLDNFEKSKKYVGGNYSQSPVCVDCKLTINGINDHSKCNSDIEYKDMGEKSYVPNNHPTVKPINLIEKIMILFKQPKICNQKVYIPFSGVGSEIIGTFKAGIKDTNIYACEINPNYIKIALGRIKYWFTKFSIKKNKLF